MAHVFELTDEQYARLEATARERGESPADLFQSWLDSIAAQATRESGWGDVTPPTEEEIRQRPLLALAGSLTLNDPRLATSFDDVLAEAIADDHAGTK
jgi:hypothetical protein